MPSEGRMADGHHYVVDLQQILEKTARALVR
jgi:hypothetical protein